MTQPGSGATFVLQSSAFADGQALPSRHTGDGEDLSPALSWSGAPAGVKQFAIICDDPDAPRAEPWVHWVIYAIPADCTGLGEGLPRQARLDKPAGARQGVNSWSSGNLGYRGPAPPPGKVHHYHFKLYALDTALDLKDGADKAALLAAMKDHILAQTELVGTYKR